MPINFSTNKDRLTELGFGSGGINDGWFQYLGSLGYTGSIDDRWRAFLRATYSDRPNASLGDLMHLFFLDGGAPGGGGFETELTLNAFSLGPDSAAPIFSGRREQNSGLVLVSGSGEPDAVVQGRMVAADNALGWLASGQTLAQFHTAIIDNTNNAAVGAGTQDGGFKSLSQWVTENPTASIVTDVNGDRLLLGAQAYYAVGVDFSNVRIAQTNVGELYMLACKAGGDNAGAAIQWDFDPRWVIEMRRCDIVGNNNATGAGAFIRRSDGGTNTGRLVIENCDIWGWGADIIQLRGNDRARFNRLDAPTSISADAVAYTAGTYQIGDIVTAAGSDPTVASKRWTCTVPDNTDSPIFSPAGSGNGWTLLDIHADMFVMRPGDSGTTEVFGNVINMDYNRRFHPNALFNGSANSALWGKTQGDYSNVECRGNLVMTNPDYNGGTPCSNLSNAIVAFNRIETRGGVENGVWLGVVVQAPVRVQGNTDPRYSDNALSFAALTEDVHYTVISSESAETGDTMIARTGGLLPHIYQGTYADIATADGSGDFEGYITGAPRSLYAYKAQTRYRDAANPEVTTSNHCFVGHVLARYTQSNARWLTDENFKGVSPTATVALHDNRVRVITLNRDPAETTPADPEDLIVLDVAGSPATNRDPIWRFANVLMEAMPDGPIIVMGHAREGTNDRMTVDDSQDKRFWEDELLIAQAGQPHIVDGARPAAVDIVNWAFTASSEYTNEAQNFGIIGRIAFGVDPSGDPVTPGTLIDSFIGFTYTQDHSWADIYDWNYSKLAFDEYIDTDENNVPVNAAREAFETHPVYGDFVTGFPLKFSPQWGVYGNRNTGTGLWADFAHFSREDFGGASHAAAVAGLVIARAAGQFDEGQTALDWIQWSDDPLDPLDVAADKGVVYVGIDGRNITTQRRILDALGDTPSVVALEKLLGDVIGFRINGERTFSATIETVGGFDRIAIRKDSAEDFTGLDVLTWAPEQLNYGTIPDQPSLTDAEKLNTLGLWLDYPLVETGLTSMPGIHIDTFVEDGLFDSNPFPAPSVDVTLLQHANHGAIASGSPVNIATVTGHDGSPLAIFISYDSTIANSNMYPNATTLGGVSIEPQTAQSFTGAIGVSVFFVESPGTGDLDLDVGFAFSADQVNFAIVRVDTGTFGTPTVGAGGVASTTQGTTGLISPSNNSTALHFVMSQNRAAEEALSGAGEWMGPEVTNALMRTRIAKVEGVASGATSGFIVDFALATRLMSAAGFVIPEE